MSGLNTIEMSSLVRPRRSHAYPVPNADRIAMSQKERDVLKVLHGILAGQRTQAEAARLLRISVRQVRRLQRKL